MDIKLQSLVILMVLLLTSNTASAQKEVNQLLNDMKSQNQEVRTQAMRSLIQRGEAAVPEVVGVLRDKDAIVRASAIEVLAAIGGPDAADLLIPMLEDEHIEVRIVVAMALGKMQATKAVGPLISTLLTDQEWQVRMYAARSLGQIQDQKAVDPLLQHVKDKSREEQERRVAILALGALKATKAKEALVGILADTSEDFRLHTAAVAALGDIGDPSVEDVLVERLQDQEDKVVYNTVVALGKLKSQKAVDRLLRILRNEKAVEVIRINSALALGSIGGEQATLALIEDLNREDEYMAMYAAKALERIGDKRAIGAINDLLNKTQDSYIRKNLEEIIKHLLQ